MSGQLGQAPIPAENASFLHRASSLKIIEQGTATVVVSNSLSTDVGAFTTTVTHNLGYRPIALAFSQSSFTPLPYLVFGAGSIAGFGSIQPVNYMLWISEVTTTTITFQVNCVGTTFNGNSTLQYYLFAESAD